MPCFKSSLVVACVALVGCSSGGGTTDAGSTITFTEFCGKYTDAVAGQYSTCLGGPKEIWLKSINDLVRCSEQTHALDGGRAVYDPAFAQFCLTAASALSCTSLLDSATAPDCVKTLNGKVAVGSTCYGEIDCGDTAYCAKAAASCSGTCKAKIAAGAACAVGDSCVAGYSCINSICTLTPPAGTADLGGSCAGSVNCKVGLACDRITNNCVKPIKEGQACPVGHGICEFFTACASTSSSCVRFASAGGACGRKPVPDGGIDYEATGCLDSYCKPTAGSMAGTCAARIADMGVCGASDECLSGTCTASKCAARCVIP